MTEQSIFGVAAPQFECDSVIHELDYVVVDSFIEQWDKKSIQHESIRNRHRKWTEKGIHFTFGITMNLYKYGEEAAQKYTELKSCYRQLVKLWRRRDGEPFMSVDDVVVLFRFNKLVPFYRPEIPNKPDILHLEFVSQDPVDVSKTLVEV